MKSLGAEKREDGSSGRPPFGNINWAVLTFSYFFQPLLGKLFDQYFWKGFKHQPY